MHLNYDKYLSVKIEEFEDMIWLSVLLDQMLVFYLFIRLSRPGSKTILGKMNV